MNIKKYLDGSGLTHLWTRIEENYPTNEDLTNIINAIDEEKADKTDLVGKKVSNGEIFNDYANNIAQGNYSHAEGKLTRAVGQNSHTEGFLTQATGKNAHAEGEGTIATKESSHAEGSGTRSYGKFSHVEGLETIASGESQHVQGKYNIEDTENKYAHIVGNGSESNDDSKCSNAHTLDWEGNAWFAGDVYVGSTEGVNKDEGSQKLATEGYVNSSIDNALAEVSSDTIVEQNKNRDIKFWVGTQEELDTVETRDENCLYFTTDQNGGAGNASAAARCTTVTLNANNWTLNANNIYVQEVQANGVSADENAQLITISPYGNGFDNHLLAAEVFCIEQKENALVFRAINDAPDGNVQLLIVLEDINWINQ